LFIESGLTIENGKLKKTEYLPSLCQQDIEGTIAARFEKDREYCLGRVNEHLEMLLKKANMDIKLQRHMARNYYIRKWIRKSHKKCSTRPRCAFDSVFGHHFKKMFLTT
jgi:hypothetical protein